MRAGPSVVIVRSGVGSWRGSSTTAASCPGPSDSSAKAVLTVRSQHRRGDRPRRGAGVDGPLDRYRMPVRGRLDQPVPRGVPHCTCLRLPTIPWSADLVSSPRPTAASGGLASGGLAVSRRQPLVVPLLPQFPRLLEASPGRVAWLVTATLVAAAVGAPVLGRLGDMYGKRRMLLVGLGIVTFGSALGAVAPNVGVLIAARALQGVSMGVIALGISVMRDVLPPGRVGSGIALMSSSLGIGGAIGLPLTGV